MEATWGPTSCPFSAARGCLRWASGEERTCRALSARLQAGRLGPPGLLPTASPARRAPATAPDCTVLTRGSGSTCHLPSLGRDRPWEPGRARRPRLYLPRKTPPSFTCRSEMSSSGQLSAVLSTSLQAGPPTCPSGRRPRGSPCAALPGRLPKEPSNPGRSPPTPGRALRKQRSLHGGLDISGDSSMPNPAGLLSPFLQTSPAPILGSQHCFYWCIELWRQRVSCEGPWGPVTGTE